MNDKTFIRLALETSTALSGDRTNEPVLWRQMCPDRYKQSQLWVLQADPRGLSKGKEPSGTCVADPSLSLYLQPQTLSRSFISTRPIFTQRDVPIHSATATRQHIFIHLVSVRNVLFTIEKCFSGASLQRWNFASESSQTGLSSLAVLNSYFEICQKVIDKGYFLWRRQSCSFK